jgi:hypothetical protein
MSTQFWSQTSQLPSSSLHRIASAVRIAGVIRPLIQRYCRTARFPPELIFALLSSNVDISIVHWACYGLADLNSLQPGIWHPIAHLPLTASAESRKEPSFMQRLWLRPSRVAPVTGKSGSQQLTSEAISMSYLDAVVRNEVLDRVALSPQITWWGTFSR